MNEKLHYYVNMTRLEERCKEEYIILLRRFTGENNCYFIEGYGDRLIAVKPKEFLEYLEEFADDYPVDLKYFKRYMFEKVNSYMEFFVVIPEDMWFYFHLKAL